MKIFITGASGLVGSNCMNYFEFLGYNVLGTHYSFETESTIFYDTIDISKNTFDLHAFNPDVILHCGALTHVDYCENHPEESYEKNVLATKNMLDIAKELGARFVFISTDYVFDGQYGPYDESAEPNPLSIYGKHKLEAEKLVQTYDNHIILRITNVYGDEKRGKNFVSRIISQAIEAQDLNLILPSDQYATPINAVDVAMTLNILIDKNQKGIFHIGGTDYMNRVQLALRILSYFPEANYRLEPLKTIDMQQAAKRPLQGGLKNKKFMEIQPDFVFWTIDEYISSKLKEMDLN